MGGLLPGLELLGLEPEGDLLLGGLDGVGAVADVAADVLKKKGGLANDVPYKSRCAEDNRAFKAEFALTMAKSPRMVPGWEARGLVATRMTRPVLTASRPSQTMAQMGPEAM